MRLRIGRGPGAVTPIVWRKRFAPRQLSPTIG
jgi:hypothetical protein